MKVKVFETDKNGKIIFTKDELEKLLNEVYDSGYVDGKNSTYVWSSPYKWNYYGNEINTITTGTGPKTLDKTNYAPYETTCTHANIGGETHNAIGD